MLCCFSTPISDVQAETKVMAATYFMSFGKSLLQKYMASRIIKQSSKIKATFTFFDFSISYDVFSTLMFNIQAKTSWTFEDPWRSCICLQEYLFGAHEQNTKFTFFFCKMLFFNSELLGWSRDKGDDSTDFVSFGRSLPQINIASRILIQSSEIKKGQFIFFHYIFFGSTSTVFFWVENAFLGCSWGWTNANMAVASKLNSDINNTKLQDTSILFAYFRRSTSALYVKNYAI